MNADVGAWLGMFESAQFRVKLGKVGERSVVGSS